jgi:hypothetical protein
MQVYVSADDLTVPPVNLKDAQTILVRDNFGNPIFLAIQQTNEHVWTIGVDNPKFVDTIAQLGIEKRLDVRTASVK